MQHKKYRGSSPFYVGSGSHLTDDDKEILRGNATNDGVSNPLNLGSAARQQIAKRKGSLHSSVWEGNTVREVGRLSNLFGSLTRKQVELAKSITWGN
jgi:hypothetical protein